MTPEGAKRFHDLDALRAYAMLLGIVLHGLMSFMVIPFWPAQDRYQNSEVTGAILSFIHGFRLPLFFLISGFFTAMLWKKRGLKGLARQRAIRILIPLAVGTIVTWILIVPISIWGNAKKESVGKLSAESSESSAELKPHQAGALVRAVRSGEVDRVKPLIEEGAGVDEKDSGFQMTPLAWAVAKGHIEIVSLLVAAGADVNSRDGEGSTPLHVASFLGRAAEAEKLIAAGAEVNARNKDGETPLDSQRHGMRVVNWVGGMLEIEVERVPLYQGRKQVKAMLVDHGGEAGMKNAGRQWFLDLWKLGAQAPVFHHLWFLYYLCWLVLMFGVFVLVRRWIPFSIPSWVSSSPFCWLWVLPATLLFQLYMNEGVGADTAPGILPWPPKLFYYAVFFAFGALCYGKASFESKAGRFWIVWALLSVPVFVAASTWLKDSGERFGWEHWAGSLAATFFTWLMIYAHIGFFRRFFSGENRKVRYLSDSAYWLYIAHLPLIMVLQIWVSDWDFPIVVKFGFVCVATVMVLLLIYQWCVRYTLIGAVLNGRKVRPSRMAQAEP